MCSFSSQSCREMAWNVKKREIITNGRPQAQRLGRYLNKVAWCRWCRGTFCHWRKETGRSVLLLTAGRNVKGLTLRHWLHLNYTSASEFATEIRRELSSEGRTFLQGKQNNMSGLNICWGLCHTWRHLSWKQVAIQRLIRAWLLIDLSDELIWLHRCFILDVKPFLRNRKAHLWQ